MTRNRVYKTCGHSGKGVVLGAPIAGAGLGFPRYKARAVWAMEVPTAIPDRCHATDDDHILASAELELAVLVDGRARSWYLLGEKTPWRNEVPTS